LDDIFSRPFSELRKIPEALQGERIAVLIDDLDRCSAGHVVELLEAINLIMDVHGFIFVLALDYDVIVSAVQERYPYASGHAFIQKIVQLPFRVPPLEVNTQDFPDLIPDWGKWISRMPQSLKDSRLKSR
jgi:predicted KAP-like P-loop ATPase